MELDLAEYGVGERCSLEKFFPSSQKVDFSLKDKMISARLKLDSKEVAFIVLNESGQKIPEINFEDPVLPELKKTKTGMKP
ncbi:MAG: hypothetical protein PHV34_07175 [Verrucomicrobiae bacterium]|nr:hypothetical protein [Verrucomicrobiae bacterium]